MDEKDNKKQNLPASPFEPSKDIPTITSDIYHDLEHLVHIQGQDGNWNYNSYMAGMFNGMELMLATLEGREPEYKDAPEHWLEDGHPTEIQPPAVLARMLTNREIFKQS